MPPEKQRAGPMQVRPDESHAIYAEQVAAVRHLDFRGWLAKVIAEAYRVIKAGPIAAIDILPATTECAPKRATYRRRHDDRIFSGHVFKVFSIAPSAHYDITPDDFHDTASRLITAARFPPSPRALRFFRRWAHRAI